jgi:hypothetical protein
MMRRTLALTVNNLKGMKTMLYDNTMLRQMRKNSVSSKENELNFMLEMPGGLDGTRVPSSTVVSALLWQQYGLDLLHPQLSRWLEKNAPDVKYAVARNQRDHQQSCANFRVGQNGTLRVYLSPDVDARLRKVASDYFFWQVEHSLHAKHKRFEKGTIRQIAHLFNDAGNKFFTPSVAR